MTYMAKYTRIPSGYMGQIAEWPEVVTEGKNIDECREMLRDALCEMILAYRDLGKPIPSGFDLMEPLAEDMIQKHLVEFRREQIAARAVEARENYNQGKVKSGSFKELFKDLEDDLIQEGKSSLIQPFNVIQ